METNKQQKIYLVKEYESRPGGGCNEAILGAWRDKDKADAYAASLNAGRYISWDVEEVELMESFENAQDIRRGHRCGVCYWALYDGDWCQNGACVMGGKSVGENRVKLTNDEAYILIKANDQEMRAGSERNKTNA